MKIVLNANHITWKESNKRGTVYIESLTRNGVTIGEFDNGTLSGWMYTLNGHHPNLGVAQQFLDGEEDIIFHYTDDYTVEEGSEHWNIPGGGTVEEVKDVTTDAKAGTTTAPTNVKISEKTNADGIKTKVANVKVSADNQKEILKQAKEKKSNEIILVVSSKSVGDATKADVTLDKSFIDSIVKDTDAKLTVKTPFGNKTYTQEELKALSEAATGQTISGAVEKAAEPMDSNAVKAEKAKAKTKDLKLIARSAKTAKKNIKVTVKTNEQQDGGFPQRAERPWLHSQVQILSLGEESIQLQVRSNQDHQDLSQHCRHKRQDVLLQSTGSCLRRKRKTHCKDGTRAVQVCKQNLEQIGKQFHNRASMNIGIN